MSKGNGSTRTSASGNPRGLSADTPAYRYGRSERAAVEAEIEDLEYSIRELQAQQSELTDAQNRLYRDWENNGDVQNDEYFRNEIDDIDEEYNKLDSLINRNRVKIDELQKKLK